jgi:hypothetical protein
MSRSKLRHCWSGLLAVGALALSARSDIPARGTKCRESQHPIQRT